VSLDPAESPAGRRSLTGGAGRGRRPGTLAVAKAVGRRVACLSDGRMGRPSGECRVNAFDGSWDIESGVGNYVAASIILGGGPAIVSALPLGELCADETAAVRLTGRAGLKAGNLNGTETLEMAARDAIRARGGNAAIVRKIGDYANMTVGEVIQAAADGDLLADDALKIIKGAARLGQKIR
jgi:hypothetical protein